MMNRNRDRSVVIGVLIVVVVLGSTVQIASAASWDQDGAFFTPGGIAVDSMGNVYVVDSGNNRIQKFTPNGTFIAKWGTDGSGDGQFDDPLGIAVDNAGFVYVADTMNNRIQKFTSTGTFVTKWGGSGSEWKGSGSGNGQFNQPIGVAVDTSGNVYVADMANSRIQKFTSSGSFITAWGADGSGNGQFYCPRGVAVDSTGIVYVADSINSRIQKFTSTGTYLGEWAITPENDRSAGTEPSGIAIDSANNVYVPDTTNFKNFQIHKYTSTGTLLTEWDTSGSAVGGESSHLIGIAVDGTGNVYFVDSYGANIQKFAPITAENETPGFGSIQALQSIMVVAGLVALKCRRHWG